MIRGAARTASPIQQSDLPPLGGREVQLVRLRLALIVVATALIAIVSGAALSAIVAPDPDGRLNAAIRSAPLVSLGAGVLLFAGACTLTLFLARRVVEPAQELDAARRRYGDLYAAAESRALVDALTGLGNHRAFHEELERQLDLARRHRYPLVIVLLDLDDFRSLNEAAGHATGDRLLGEMTSLLRAAFRRSDRLFRVGGDEFAVLLPHSSVEDGYQATRRLLAAALTPRTGETFGREFSFSAGVTGAPELGESRSTLIDQADDALARAKLEGRTLVKVYDPDRSTRALAGPALARASAAVASLVERRALRPVYQPIVDLADGRVVGFEGLVRPTPDSGFDAPGDLFAAAEAGGRAIELDHLCIETLLAGASPMAPDQWLSLNVSPRTLEAPEFSAAWLGQLLVRGGLVPGRVVLEVTEREAVRDVDLVRRRLAACQAMGVRIAIDDVGVGNAGLRLLSEIQFDIVKIDLSLVHAGARNGNSRDVLRSIAELASRAGATAIAEGVETPAQLAVVREIGLAAAQGYLLGRPGPTPELRSVALDPLLRQSDLRTVLGVGEPGRGAELAGPSLGRATGG